MPKQVTEPPRLLGVEEIAERTGTSVRYARRLIAERRIPVVKLGHYVRVWSNDLDQYLADQLRPAEANRVSS